MLRKLAGEYPFLKHFEDDIRHNHIRFEIFKDQTQKGSGVTAFFHLVLTPTSFYEEYYGSDPDALVDAIKEYKRIKGAHKKDELYLADLLK